VDRGEIAALRITAFLIIGALNVGEGGSREQKWLGR